jgi:hypothetical protein
MNDTQLDALPIAPSVRWRLYLETFTATGDETVLFATAVSSST